MKDYSAYKQQIETPIAEPRERLTAVGTAHEEPSSPDLDDPSIEPENNQHLGSAGRASLKKIEQLAEALGRINNGTYSISHKCGEDISAERLNTVPFAHVCRDCAIPLKDRLNVKIA